MWDLGCNRKKRGGRALSTEVLSRERRLGPLTRHSISGPSLAVCCCLVTKSRLTLFATLWTVAGQAPLSVGFSRQEYRRGLLFPSPGDLPDNQESNLHLLHWQADSLSLSHQGSPPPCREQSTGGHPHPRMLNVQIQVADCMHYTIR